MNNRLFGIDLARFIAIAGMMIAHLAAPRFTWLEVPTAGFPSTLFAVLGGFGVTFAARRYLANDQTGAAVSAIFSRGVVILCLGFVMGFLPPHPIAVVLTDFGGAIMVASVLILAPSWLLAVLAAMVSLVSPPLLAAHQGSGDLGPMGYFLRAPQASFFLAGTYPVITWTTYLAIGMLLARAVQRAKDRDALGAAARWMILGGGAIGSAAWIVGEWYLRTSMGPRLGSKTGDPLAALRESQMGHPGFGGWDSLLTVAPHTGSTVDILRTGGIATAIIGLCLVATLSWSGVPWLARPFIGAGAAPLTIYVLHLVMTSFALLAAGGMEVFWSLDAPWWIEWWIVWQLALVLAVGGTLSALGRRGPLETATSRISRFAAELVSGT